MCLILFAHRAVPGHALVLAANRDEFFARSTESAHYWTDAPHVLAGRDLEKGGTWMGVTRDGRWAAVTNFREGTRTETGTRSRGQLVARYLLESSTAASYAAALTNAGTEYHGFNLLVGDSQGVHYVSNRGARARVLEPGIYGLSNHLLDTSWPKVERGKREMEALIAGNATDPTERLLAVLADCQPAAAADLPETGVSRDWEKLLSSAFIRAPGYGTRASSVLLIAYSGEASLHERSFDASAALLEDRRFRFTLAPAFSPPMSDN
ncbi:MAG TPA: NRDE family protein [Burkholderiales bacterium]|nr:NRDE family protein [Burkholderiales bacterium]